MDQEGSMDNSALRLDPNHTFFTGPPERRILQSALLSAKMGKTNERIDSKRYGFMEETES